MEYKLEAGTEDKEPMELSEEEEREAAELRAREYDEERKQQYKDNLRHLRSLQHQIDDSAKLLAQKLGATVGRYNHWLEVYKPFMREYAQEHAGVNKTTGEKEKFCKDIESGAGVFFEATQRTISFNQELLPLLFEELGKLEDDKEKWPEGIKLKDVMDENQVTTYEVIDSSKLFKVLAAFEIDKANYGIKVTEGDAYARMKIGTVRGWTPNKAQEVLSKALKGQVEEGKE